jgi:hypothetical protein
VRQRIAAQAQLQRRRSERYTRQALAQQRLQMRRIGRGFGQTDRQLAVTDVAAARLVMHAQREASHACMTRTRPRQQTHDQHACAGH